MVYKLIGIIGLTLIIIGTFLISEGHRVKRKKIYPFLFLGGVCLAVYSFYINDIIFIVLQISYIIIVLYDIAKLNSKRK